MNEVKYPIEIKDENGKVISKKEKSGLVTDFFYNENGNEIYRETSNDYWRKLEYDENGNVIYRENSKDGVVMDKRSEDQATNGFEKETEKRRQQILEKLNN